MSKQNFLLLSLDDDGAKEIASAVSNKSCRKILDFLAQQDATETELSEKLSLPISTVHYNLEQLKKAGLVDWEKYHYSKKGKEVRHYTLTNKYIIIAPKKDPGFLEKLKGILPAFGFSIVASVGIWFLGKKDTVQESLVQAKSSALYESADLAQSELFESRLAMDAPVISEPSLWTQIISEPAFYFFIGALFALLFIVLTRILKKK